MEQNYDCMNTQWFSPLHGRILGEGAGGAHPSPPRDDLLFSNTTGILPKKKLCGLLVLKYSKRRVHPLLKKILDPPLHWPLKLPNKIRWIFKKKILKN